MRQPLLALLAKEPAHGYELKLALEQIFGGAYPSPNIGQIYVTLKRLEQDGLVRSEDVEQTTRPNKRVYELTPAGRDVVAAWVDEPSDGPRVRDEFFAKLILAPRAGLADQMDLGKTFQEVSEFVARGFFVINDESIYRHDWAWTWA